MNNEKVSETVKNDSTSQSSESDPLGLHKPMTRREALSTIAKVGIGVAAAVVIGGGAVGGYYYLQPKSPGPTTLNYMTAAHVDFWYDQESYKPLATYQQSNPNITINPIVYSFFDVESKMSAAFTAGSYTWDVAYVWGGLLSEFLKYFTPLTNLGWNTSQIQSDLIPWVQNAISYKGTYYGYPRMNEVFLLNANKSALDAAGITSMPTSYEQLLQYCKEVNKPSAGVYAFGAGLKVGYLFPVYLTFLHANGGYLWKQDGPLTPIPDDPKSIAAVTDMVEIFQNYMNPGATGWIADVQTSTDFLQGKHVFDLWYPSHNWVVTQSGTAVTSVYCDVFPGHSGVVAAASQVASEGYAIPTTAKYPNDALKFVEYVGQLKNQVECYTTGGWTPNAQAPLPSFFSYYNDPGMTNWPFAYTVKAHLKASMFNCSRYERPAYTQISNAIEAEVSNALAGTKTPTQAMTDARTATDSIVSTEYATYGGGYYQPWLDVQKSSFQTQFQNLLNNYASVGNFYTGGASTVGSST